MRQDFRSAQAQNRLKRRADVCPHTHFGPMDGGAPPLQMVVCRPWRALAAIFLRTDISTGLAPRRSATSPSLSCTPALRRSFAISAGFSCPLAPALAARPRWFSISTPDPKCLSSKPMSCIAPAPSSSLSSKSSQPPPSCSQPSRMNVPPSSSSSSEPPPRKSSGMSTQAEVAVVEDVTSEVILLHFLGTVGNAIGGTTQDAAAGPRFGALGGSGRRRLAAGAAPGQEEDIMG
mmetsp:Transcript_37893/g.100241  ORF Transcript_37893/g.100241 Transcript_37893/m.100241 type:complete len:233 (+) Transcript_37893:302-1000(+)